MQQQSAVIVITSTRMSKYKDTHTQTHLTGAGLRLKFVVLAVLFSLSLLFPSHSHQRTTWQLQRKTSYQNHKPNGSTYLLAFYIFIILSYGLSSLFFSSSTRYLKVNWHDTLLRQLYPSMKTCNVTGFCLSLEWCFKHEYKRIIWLSWTEI